MQPSNHGETNWVSGSIKNCRAGKDNGGGFYQNYGKAYFQNVNFEGNYSEDNGGAYYCDTDAGLWFIGCKMLQNSADDDVGAIYMNKKNMYLEDCSVTSNAAIGDGGGIYVSRSGSIIVSGTTAIRSNDGNDTLDNLVLGRNALVYDYGLMPGAEIHLRSTSDGDAKISGSLTSEYQFSHYFHANHGKLELTDTETVNTELRA